MKNRVTAVSDLRTVRKVAGSYYALAADIGGTQTRVVVAHKCTSGIEIIAKRSVRTLPERGLEVAGRELAQIMLDLLQELGLDSVAGAGIASAGPLRPWDGVYVHPPNLRTWHGKSIKPIVEERLGFPITIGHDATLCAFAESRIGPYKGARNLLYVTVSTGVGGGIIVNGEMACGESGGAGEIGHILICPGERRCNVGCDGCFEGNASGSAIAAMGRKAAMDFPDSLLATMAGGDMSTINGEMVLNAAEGGDDAALAIVSKVINTIGKGVASLLNIFDPQVVCLGGGVVEGLRPRWKEVEAAVTQSALPRYKKRGAPVSATTFGDDAGVLGAALLAFEEM